MENYKSDLMQTLTQRGYLYQCTDEAALDKAADEGQITGYIGFDCTAPSLHVGSMVQIMMLRARLCGAAARRRDAFHSKPHGAA